MWSSIHYSCSLNSGPRTSKDCQLAAKHCWNFLWCAHLRLRDLNPGHHFWGTSVQTHRIHFSEFPLSIRLYRVWAKKWTIWLTSIPRIGFGINKWMGKMWAYSSVKGDLKSVFVNMHIHRQLIFLFSSSLESELFLHCIQKGIFESLKHSIASYPIHLFSHRTEFGITSIYLHPICDLFFFGANSTSWNLLRLHIAR